MQRANPTDLKILKRSSNFAVIYAYILKYREYPQTPNSLNQLQYAISPRLTPLCPQPGSKYFYAISQ